MNPWHDVPVGEDIEQYFNVIIEIPKGSKNKYEMNKVTGLLQLDRVLFSAVHSPANYGFIPQSLCDDGDPIDVLALGQEPVHPLCIVRVRAIGVITMSDEKGIDDKIIAVQIDDPEYTHYRDISELPEHRLKELRRFFIDYKVLEGKKVLVEDLRGRIDAYNVVRDAILCYNQNKTELLKKYSR
jgi:inorganic pyrophosphatase